MAEEKSIHKLSIIVTCYFEESTIREFHTRLSDALRTLKIDYEIVLVNDGSTDKTFEKLEEIYERDENVSAIVDLFKNFGQRAAIAAGLQFVQGDAVLMIDSDLQLDPAELPRLYESYLEGSDVVSGYRENRKDSFARIVPSKIANMIMRRISRSQLRDFGCTFKIYDASLLRALEFGPHRIFDPALTIAQAQRVSEVPIRHFPRAHGKSGWTFRKLWDFNMDNFVNLSRKPFQVLGFVCGALALLILVRVALALFTDFVLIDEVTNGLLLNAVAVSLLIVCAILAVLGEFVIRTFMTLRGVPHYVVRVVRHR